MYREKREEKIIMTNLFNYDVTGKVEVLVTGTKFQNNAQKFLVAVTDVVEGSPTKGWSLEYTPRLNSQGELFDPSQTFNTISVPNFSEIQNQVFGAVMFFAQDQEVNAEIAQGKTRVRRVYEGADRPFRITVSKQRNSFYVLLRVVDATSPFYMVALEFTVTPDKMNPNQPYIVGIGQRLNQTTGVYTTFDAYFVDSKRMFIEVYRNNEMYNLGNTVITGQSQNGYTIDNRNSAIQYIQKVDTIFKAQAFIVEQSIMEYVFMVAKEQTTNVQAQQQAPATNGGFANFFGNAGQQPQFNQQAPQFNVQPQFNQPAPMFQAPQFPQGTAPMQQSFQGVQPNQMFQSQQPAPQFNPGFNGQQAPAFQAPTEGVTNVTVSDLPPGL